MSGASLLWDLISRGRIEIFEFGKGHMVLHLWNILWNCNSLAKEDFHRLRLIEAQNSIFNYDLISLCETRLNDQVSLPDPQEYVNNEYTFIPANKPNNTRHGGVGLFYKNSLPLKVSDDLSFEESITLATSILIHNLIIREPTNFQPNRNPSCIDLIITDQPNLNSG